MHNEDDYIHGFPLNEVDWDSLEKIGEEDCECETCDWIGTVFNCEVNEETGDLHCPSCGEAVNTNHP